MANYNQWTAIGRLTRDPESVKTSSDAKAVKFGFAVNSRRRNSVGVMEDEPMYIDCVAWTSGEFKLGDVVERYARKGSQLMITGELRLEQWVDKKSGDKRSRHSVVVRSVQLLDPKPENGANGQHSAASAPKRQPAAPAPASEDGAGAFAASGAEEENGIPF